MTQRVEDREGGTLPRILELLLCVGHCAGCLTIRLLLLIPKGRTACFKFNQPV